MQGGGCRRARQRMDCEPLRSRRSAEARGRGSAHRLRAGFRDPVRRVAGGPAPRAGLTMILQAANFGREYLQDMIGREFLLAKHIGVVVESADDDAVVLRAPLAANANHQGTAFGGSLYSLAVLSGWAWLPRYLA